MSYKFNVFIIDDVPENIQLAAKIIKSETIEISFTTSGKNILERVKEKKFDLILLDIMLPEVSGFEICRQLKADQETKDIPVIFLTAKNDIDSIAKAFELGAVDYVTKPFHKIELKARVETHLNLRYSKKQLEYYAEKLKEKNEKLKKLSRFDSLTELYNRRYMTLKMKEEQSRYNRNKKTFCFVLADIDHFKKINDTYGHDCGDYVLKNISQMMKDIIRTQDSIARWGGEEFLFLLPETNISEAQKFAQRVKKRLEKMILECEGEKIMISMTFGISAYNNRGIDEAIKRADNALYKGKKTGRNKVVIDQ